MQKLTEEQMRETLRDQITYNYRAKELAADLDVAPQYLSAMLSGKVMVSTKAAAKLGYEKVTETYFVEKK